MLIASIELYPGAQKYKKPAKSTVFFHWIGLVWLSSNSILQKAEPAPVHKAPACTSPGRGGG